MSKLYAQFNTDGICICVGTPKTDVEATYDCLGKKYVNGSWVDEVIAEENKSIEEAIMEDEIIKRICPICNAELTEGGTVCPTCDYDLTQLEA